ncbi:MAG: TetR/AcrR family transcriptional regulator [Streptosporangiaceae bacterium]
MTSEMQAPTGLARRGRRRSDRETEERMLQAAVAMVHRTGLTVSLDHISLEEVIRDADVSRSAVYRRWPYKDLFFSDLVKELARNATPTIVNDELKLMRQVVAEYQDLLQTPEGRRGLVIELFRRLSLLDFETMYHSPGWRTYIALHATFLSLADGALRDQVQTALAESEHAHNVRIARVWQQLTAIFGYRLRPEVGVTFESLATLLSATLRGLIIMALSTPGIAGQRVEASPFGAAGQDEWSLPAIGLAGLAFACVEPDPGIRWDDDRLASVRRALRDWVPPDG